MSGRDRHPRTARAVIGGAIGWVGDREETYLARRLLGRLGEGMLLLGDRAYDSGEFLAAVDKTGGEVPGPGWVQPRAVGTGPPDGSYLSDVAGLAVRGSPRPTWPCTGAMARRRPPPTPAPPPSRHGCNSPKQRVGPEQRRTPDLPPATDGTRSAEAGPVLLDTATGPAARGCCPWPVRAAAVGRGSLRGCREGRRVRRWMRIAVLESNVCSQ